MNLLERISGARVQEAQRALSPNLRSLGADVMGTHLGGCNRALWYELNDVPVTEPEKESLRIGRHIDNLLRSLFLDKVRRVSPLLHVPYEWQIPTQKGPVHGSIDAIYKDPETHEPVGLYVFSGGGYGFQTEVFGTKTRAGQIKDNHLVQCWAALTLCPIPLSKIEVIYIDRGLPEKQAIYEVPKSFLSKDEILQFLTDATSETVSRRDYEPQWTDRVKVASLYAEKKISKSVYEDFQETGIGSDWQCTYCPWRTRCEGDGI